MAEVMMIQNKPTALSSLSKRQARDAIHKLVIIKHNLLVLYCCYITNKACADDIERNQHNINETISTIFGQNSIEYETYCVDFVSVSTISYIFGNNISTNEIRKSINSSIVRLDALISLLEEQAGEDGANIAGKTIRVYEDLKSASRYRTSYVGSSQERALFLRGRVRRRSAE